jgi:cyclohexadienyl dehydratase
MRNYLLFLLISLLAACHTRSPLKVGTTGDYQPFTVWTGAEPVGSDITMARAFARSQGREVVFVRTSWNNLLDDLHAGWFSLAISGITVTEHRKHEAAFTRPYFHGRKVALVRCEDSQRFAHSADIDVKGVRVVYNTGGTNEAFARATIKHATLDSEAQNLRALARLADGDVDAFFTDDIEAVTVTRSTYRDVLCITAADENLAPFDIAVMGIPGSSDLERFDAWLAKPENQSAIDTVLVVTNSSKP